MNADDLVIIDTINDELRSALDALAGGTFETSPGALSGPVWIVRAELDAWPPVTLFFDQVGASTLAAAFPGADATSDHAAIAGTVRDICTQALGAAATRPPATGARPIISKPQLGEWSDAIEAAVTTFRSSMLSQPLVIGVSTVAASVVEEPAPAVDVAAEPEPSALDRLSVILDIDLPLVVRFGATSMPLKALTRLGPGSLIDLSRSPDDPVDVLVSNRVVARGEVVVVGGSYGVRILDVVSPRERLRGLEA